MTPIAIIAALLEHADEWTFEEDTSGRNRVSCRCCGADHSASDASTWEHKTGCTLGAAWRAGEALVAQGAA